MRPQEWRKHVARLAAEYGWDIDVRRGGHLRLSKPGRTPIFTSCSASDRRALKNLAAMIRRHERQADS